MLQECQGLISDTHCTEQAAAASLLGLSLSPSHPYRKDRVQTLSGVSIQSLVGRSPLLGQESSVLKECRVR
jgi:hypothetical protein